MLPRPGGRPRLRLTARSVVVAVALFGATLALLSLVAASARVIGWVLAAAVAAGVLHPLVSGLSRWIPRALALAVVALATLGTVGVFTWQVVDDVVEETRALQRALPHAARDVERSESLGEVAREARLVERTEQLVDAVPQLLQGGTPAETFRSAATRGVAFLATGILSLFFLVHGRRLAAAALAQIPDDGRRERLAAVATAAYWRAWRYAAGNILLALGGALLTWVLARWAGVPGPAALALWMGLWDLVPVVGVLVGAVPVVALGAVESPGLALWLGAALLAYQGLEALLLQGVVERRSLHLGPFLTLVAGAIGLETYGIGGALVAVALLALGVAVVEELAADRVDAPALAGAAG